MTSTQKKRVKINNFLPLFSLKVLSSSSNALISKQPVRWSQLWTKMTSDAFHYKEMALIGWLMHTHTQTRSKGPQILSPGCYDCMSLPAVREMKVCLQEIFFSSLLSINANVKNPTKTTLLSSTEARTAGSQTQAPSSNARLYGSKGLFVIFNPKGWIY